MLGLQVLSPRRRHPDGALLDVRAATTPRWTRVTCCCAGRTPSATARSSCSTSTRTSCSAACRSRTCAPRGRGRRAGDPRHRVASAAGCGAGRRSSSSPASTPTSRIPGTDGAPVVLDGDHPVHPGRGRVHDQEVPGRPVLRAAATDGITVGDELTLTGPYGSSTLKDGHVLPVVCIAGGAGMAPILSLLRHMGERAASARSASTTAPAPTADLFYLDEIDGSAGPARLRGSSPACRSRRTEDGLGRRDEGNVTDVVDRHGGRHQQDRGLPVRPAADGRRRDSPCSSAGACPRTRSSTTSSPARATDR